VIRVERPARLGPALSLLCVIQAPGCITLMQCQARKRGFTAGGQAAAHRATSGWARAVRLGDRRQARTLPEASAEATWRRPL
jgi:hypothetical protein